MAVPHIAWPPGDFAAARCFARPFASEPADLDSALAASMSDAATVAAAITRLLVSCVRDGEGVPPRAETARQWSVPRRRQGLVAIAYATVGAQIQACARCRNCRDQIELELGLESFASETTDHVELEVDGRRITCRLPNGDDLEDWSRDGSFDAAWLATRLVTAVDGAAVPADWTTPPAWLDPIDAALEAVDSLAALDVTVRCPGCDTGLDVTLDLEPLVLGALREVARETLEDVHRLARAYHWTESHIVAMPRDRRRAYLARLERELA